METAYFPLEKSVAGLRPCSGGTNDASFEGPSQGKAQQQVQAVV